ncbi:hypothetical protein KC363_g3633 [Hortaea werneckii]|nr:hypothetical protein KC363_g3633 [Hortaea werneckii]
MSSTSTLTQITTGQKTPSSFTAALSSTGSFEKSPSSSLGSDSTLTQVTSGEQTRRSLTGALSSTGSFEKSPSSSLTISTATSSSAPTQRPSIVSTSSSVASGFASSSWNTSGPPLPTATGIPSCSTQDEQSTYTDPSTGSVYVVQCNKEYQGVVERSIYEPGVEECVTDCSTNTRCIGVGYDTEEEICNEYSALVPASGNHSQSVVFAQMRARAVIYDGGLTTTVPISTSYVPSTAVTTPLPPSMAGDTSVSIPSTSLSLSSSSFSLTSTPNAVLTSSGTSSADTKQPTSLPSTLTPTRSLPESSSSSSLIQNLPSGPSNSLNATQPASSETTGPSRTTARTASQNTLSSPSQFSGGPSQTVEIVMSSSNTSMATQSTSASELSLILSSTSQSSASSVSASFSSLRTSSSIDDATTSLTAANPTKTLDPSATVCPDYDDSAAVDENGVVYHVQCGVAYNGTVINSSSQKRQAVFGYTMLQCTDMCDMNEECVGLTLGSDGRCTQYSYVSGYLPDQAPVAAVPLARVARLPTEISVAAASTNALSSSLTFDFTTETSSAGALTYVNVSTEFPAQASTGISTFNTSIMSSNLPSSQAAPTKSASPPPVVTIFVTPSTCSAYHSVQFSTTTTYTTVTAGAPS